MNIPRGLVQNPPTGHIRHYEMDDNSDTDSECKTGEVNVPLGLVQNSSTGIMRTYETTYGLYHLTDIVLSLVQPQFVSNYI